MRGDFLGPPRSTDKTTLIIKVSKGAKIRNQVPHQWESDKLTVRHNKPEPRGQPLFSGEHEPNKGKDNIGKILCAFLFMSDIYKLQRVHWLLSQQSQTALCPWEGHFIRCLVLVNPGNVMKWLKKCRLGQWINQHKNNPKSWHGVQLSFFTSQGRRVHVYTLSVGASASSSIWQRSHASHSSLFKNPIIQQWLCLAYK